MKKDRRYYIINAGNEHVGTVTAINDSWLNKNVTTAINLYLKRKDIKVDNINFKPLECDDVDDGSDVERVIYIVKTNNKEIQITIKLQKTWFIY